MVSNLSEGIGNIPLTPDVQGVAQQPDNVTPVAFQNLPPQPGTEMEQTFVEHMEAGDGSVLPILPENIADDTLRIAPLPVEQTPQPAENATAVDEPMQGIQQEPDNVEMMMQNLFQEPENAALAVSIRIGENSFVHALPTHEVIEQEPVQPQDNIAGRLRPARRRRRLEFEGSPPSPDPPRRRRRRRRQGARAADDVAAADGNAAPHDDLGVMQLPEVEPRQEPAEGFGRTFLDTPEDIRKNKFIEKLKELQIEHGNVINFLQICPFESTLRVEAAAVFGMLIDLCHSKQIELIQDVPYAPDKLFIKINFGV
ncbi:hypothetical protein LSTR_LSTR001687 [Laodelphax striatellus]|uniref:Uncharacterized protein n=1 Tax=Laodelphax striatellus TaxID=195883 RepID=A0A482XCE4_LAOST|nr:hypothetical protein LSTR_LSTR001687 [Laodelphax striatellus]